MARVVEHKQARTIGKTFHENSNNCIRNGEFIYYEFTPKAREQMPMIHLETRAHANED